MNVIYNAHLYTSQCELPVGGITAIYIKDCKLRFLKKERERESIKSDIVLIVEFFFIVHEMMCVAMKAKYECKP